MIIYTKPTYSSLPNKPFGAPLWPTVVTAQVTGQRVLWTVVYPDGTHCEGSNTVGLAAIDPCLTPDFLRAHYLVSRKALRAGAPEARGATLPERLMHIAAGVCERPLEDTFELLRTLARDMEAP